MSKAVKSARRLSPEEYSKICSYLRSKRRWQDLFMVVFGYETGYRPGDMVHLRMQDVVFLTQGERFTINESKKLRFGEKRAMREVLISKTLAETIKELTGKPGGLSVSNLTRYVFTKKSARVSTGVAQPVISETINDRMKAIGKELNLDTLNGYSLRKGYAYNAYLFYRSRGNGHDYALAIVQQMMNHESLMTTARYLGFVKDEIAEFYNR